MLAHWYTLLLLQPPATGPREVWRGDSPIATQVTLQSGIATQVTLQSGIATQVTLQSGIDLEELTP